MHIYKVVLFDNVLKNPDLKCGLTGLDISFFVMKNDIAC